MPQIGDWRGIVIRARVKVTFYKTAVFSVFNQNKVYYYIFNERKVFVDLT